VNNNTTLLGRNIIRTVYHFNVVFFIKQMWYNIGTFNNKEEGYSYEPLLLKIIRVPPSSELPRNSSKWADAGGLGCKVLNLLTTLMG
jgi:hypothetical protein